MYMMVNIVFQAWIIGSMTLLIVKNDQKTGEFRDTLQTLAKYSKMNGFETSLHKRLKAQLKLDFNNSEICDESVLSKFPSSLRRRVLRRLYLPSLMQTSLVKGIRQQFVDAFLTMCRVEIFSPGEEILQRGSVSSDLYLLVAGTVELTVKEAHRGGSSGGSAETANLFGSIPDSEMTIGYGSSGASKLLHDGEFINEVGFFTESPQSDNVRTLTVCKTLTMSRSAYKVIAEDHPGSAGKILQNLLAKVEDMALKLDPAPSPPNLTLSKRLAVLRAGSVFDTKSTRSGKSSDNKSFLHDDPSSSHAYEIQQTVASVQTHAALMAIQELVKMHISKQKDDHTTRFLFAASRGDTNTIDLMCGQGFDPNSADYDQRTALMV
jgi:CRP-like cAMP-binding protein